MRPLVVLKPTTKYAALQEAELKLAAPGAARLAGQLWRLPPALAESSLEPLVGLQQLLQPLVRASSFELLLAELAREPLPPASWTLHFAAHGGAARRAVSTSGAAGGAVSATQTDYLCAVAQRLTGTPALGAPGGIHLVLLRTPRLWYLAEATVHREPRHDDGAWAARPYSFSAATDLGLARLAVSLALLGSRQHEAESPDNQDGDTGSGDAATPLLLDPCCGSGTVLHAAACLGVRSVGCDLNPTAVEGAAANLRHSAQAHAWAARLEPRVIVHDCNRPLPEAARGARLVVASLPWGRQQRIPHATYLASLLGTLAQQLGAGATFVLLSAEPADEMLAAAGLDLTATAAVGSSERQLCHVSVATPVAAAVAAVAEELPADRTAGHTPDGAEGGAVAAAATEVLCGSGLRGASSTSRLPAVGETVEVQCRMEDGSRRWLEVRVLNTAADRCRVEWATADALPEELELAVWRGTNWRRPSEVA